METNRRTFLKAGALGLVALAVGGGLYRATRPASAARFVLDGEAKAALDAIIPAVLDGVLPAAGPARQQAIAGTTARVHAAIAGLPLPTQGELQDLFGLLALAPARFALTRMTHGWADASVGEVADFLEHWRESRVGLLQSAYFAVHDLVFAAWYAEPSSWQAIGYPGPMKELS
jgi:hypothetical protein